MFIDNCIQSQFVMFKIVDMRLLNFVDKTILMMIFS